MDGSHSSHVKPLIIKKSNFTFFSTNHQNEGISLPAGKLFKNLHREDVLYDTSDMYFLKGEFQRLLLVNRYNVVTKHCRTVAKYFNKDGTFLEKNSDKVTKVIGQDQFNTLFTALCSILDEQLKVRSILALNTEKDTVKAEKQDQGSEKERPMKVLIENSCQTDEMRIEPLKPIKKRVRRVCSPYIVQDTSEEKKKVSLRSIRRVVIPIPSVSRTRSTDSGTESLAGTPSAENLIGQDVSAQNNVSAKRGHNNVGLPDLGYLHDEEHSSDSDTRLSVLSDTPTHPELISNPLAICNTVDQHTKETYKCVVQGEFPIPGTDIKVAYKPEDIFHIATKENLMMLDEVQKRTLLQYQFTVDRTHCLTPMDEDGNLPIHLAVLNNDLDLLKRQCLVLKMRGASVDVVVPSNGMTAMSLAIQLELAPLVGAVARHGALLRADSAHRTPLHHAAERAPDVLRALLAAAAPRARELLFEDEELWKPEMEFQSDEELSKCLLQHMCSVYERQGYSPVMLAAMLGLHENVRLLLEHSPSSVNDKMPTSGNTPLYLAAAAACSSYVENGGKPPEEDRFRKTIEVLMEFGADPGIENNSSVPANVHTLLQEFSNLGAVELTKFIANRQLKRAHKRKNIKFKETPDTESYKLMLWVDDEGNLECKSINPENKSKRQPKKAVGKKVPDKKVVDTKAATEVMELKVVPKVMKLNVEPKVMDIKVEPKAAKKNSKLVILENSVLKAGNADLNNSPKAVSGETTKNVETKVSPKNVKLTQRNVIVLKNAAPRVGQGVKRKQSDGPNVMKQAKVSE